MGNSVMVTVDGDFKGGAALGAAAKGVKTVGEAADKAQADLRKMETRLEQAETKSRKLAFANEQAAEKTRRLAASLQLARTELETSGDKTGALSRKVDRLTTDLRFATIAQNEYRTAAGRANNEAREQARALDRVSDNARQAARNVALLGAATKLSSGGGKGGKETLGLGAAFSEGLLKGGLGGGAAAVEGTLGTPVVGPALLAAGLPAAAGAGVFAGAAAGGGIGLGIAGAGAAAGLGGAFAGDPQKYAAQWEDAADRFKKRWVAASASFGDELTSVIHTADQSMQALPVEKLLGASHGFGAALATGAGQGAVAVVDGLADAMGRMQPIIDRVGPALGDLGHDVGDMLRAISYGSEGGADALGDLISLVGALAKGFGILILGLENTYADLRSLAIGAADAYRELSPLGGVVEDWIGSALGADSSQQQLGRSLSDTAAAAEGMGGAILGGIGAANEATLASDSLATSLTNTHNAMLAIADANVAVAQGWIDLKKELDDGKKTLDLTTQAGIDNQKSIIDQVGALERQREQAIATGDGSAEAAAKANAAYAAQVEQLRQAAYAAGFNKQEVDKLIGSLTDIPQNTKANVEVTGLGSALSQGISLGNALNRIDGYSANASVTVHYRTQGQALNAPLRTGGIPHAATGGPQGRDTLVGEEGPEIVRLPTGSMVYPAANTRQMRAQGGAGGGAQRVAVELHFTGSGGDYDWFMQAQRDGRVQVLSSAIVSDN